MGRRGGGASGTALEKYALLEALGEWRESDGAAPREVIVKFGEASLTAMTMDGEPITHWALGSLRAVESRERGLTVAPEAGAEERITTEDPDMIAALEAVCPDLHAPQEEQTQARRPRIWPWAVAAAAALLAAWGVTRIPGDAIAPLIAEEQRASLGRIVAARIAGLDRCASPEGLAALRILQARIGVAGEVVVTPSPGRGWAMLPGGMLVVSSEALLAAKAPEEVAAALAHAAAHERAGDPFHALLRAGGPWMATALVFGRSPERRLPEMAATAAAPRYGPEEEAAADAAALAALAEAGLPAAAHAAHLETLARRAPLHAGPEAGFAARAAAQRREDPLAGAEFRPALSDNQWIALRQICE